MLNPPEERLTLKPAFSSPFSRCRITTWVPIRSTDEGPHAEGRSIRPKQKVREVIVKAPANQPPGTLASMYFGVALFTVSGALTAASKFGVRSTIDLCHQSKFSYAMSHPLTIDYPNSWNHAMNRARKGEELFASKADYQKLRTQLLKVKQGLDTNSLCYAFRAEDRGKLMYSLCWSIYLAFEKAGIVIPFPQHDIHVHVGFPSAWAWVTACCSHSLDASNSRRIKYISPLIKNVSTRSNPS